ncbi:SAM-dependent methyltransferase [Carnobacterium divergens]|uniref:class I SAM-dependent methyltransferase n=1 Tax=Carnobacterium divergens TaxID=2748 RepID=UPI001071A8DE|nr:class I SAM-dependent methyltransferase [Carnobacterium divergens]MDT1997331.1 class I SAM-dependent methyltransferase [Carnobacterium divergens]TFI66060.1 SAM-dependent methyltransferase [Carnobacterium divergens]TFI66119.1 SAM-dependent methyltransferase [Carnobacterium divergens]TFI80881.1 SAM-dependent methyltransferase [Carnobacterium divergens]TFI91467.1 SAM-dependent methyltransferase [Carnobacterium divergens]
MKENKYDQAAFFQQYRQMNRSKEGLAGAGEWHELEKMLPDFKDKRVLDLGCGFGWHCIYAVEHGASDVIGIDLSENMLAEAKKKTDSPKIHYLHQAIEDYDYPKAAFDCVISSLAFHYLADFDAICKKINHTLKPDGTFVFSVEHPVFTACGTQDWYTNDAGEILHWPVDRYFIEGKRVSHFLGEDVTKYHKTLTTYLNSLLKNGFDITSIVEPEPAPELLATIPEMQDELRRPMMLLVSARKK